MNKIADLVGGTPHSGPNVKDNFMHKHPGWGGLIIGTAGNLVGSAAGHTLGIGFTGPHAASLQNASKNIGRTIGSGLAMKKVTEGGKDRFAKRHPYVAGMLGPWSHAFVGATDADLK